MRLRTTRAPADASPGSARHGRARRSACSPAARSRLRRAPPAPRPRRSRSACRRRSGLGWAWRNVPQGLLGREAGDPGVERAAFDGGAQAAHDVLVILEIVPGEQHGAEDLLAADEMVEIGTAVIYAG